MDRIAFITGGSGGIGKDVCRKLSQNGFAVAVGYNNGKQAACNLADELVAGGGKAVAVKCDVTDMTSVNAAKLVIERELGRVDTLVNNAGISSYKLFCDETEETVRNTVNVDLLGAMLVCRAFYPDMVAGKFGRIINVASIWGICGASMEVVYSAAKAGLIGFGKALALELAPSGITVNTVSPGFIDTPMNADFSKSERQSILDEIPSCRFGTGDDVASAILFLSGIDASYVTGQNIVVSGGYKNV